MLECCVYEVPKVLFICLIVFIEQVNRSYRIRGCVLWYIWLTNFDIKWIHLCCANKIYVIMISVLIKLVYRGFTRHSLYTYSGMRDDPCFNDLSVVLEVYLGTTPLFHLANTWSCVWNILCSFISTTPLSFSSNDLAPSHLTLDVFGYIWAVIHNIFVLVGQWGINQFKWFLQITVLF